MSAQTQQDARKHIELPIAWVAHSHALNNRLVKLKQFNDVDDTTKEGKVFINWAVHNAADDITRPLVTDPELGSYVEAAAIQAAAIQAATRAGIIVVVAAGNDGNSRCEYSRSDHSGVNHQKERSAFKLQ